MLVLGVTVGIAHQQTSELPESGDGPNSVGP
jgi:hypothetical protein